MGDRGWRRIEFQAARHILIPPEWAWADRSPDTPRRVVPYPPRPRGLQVLSRERKLWDTDSL
jgi:hypothetical protein